MTGANVQGLAASALDYPEPTRRELRVFALDPMVSRLSTDATTTLSVPFERLKPGPEGELLRVVDYDGGQRIYYAPIDLEDPRLSIQGGLSPSETDPRFHQQMVYAVSASLLETFERSLGRRFRWRGNNRLLLLPHAFVGRNARFNQAKDGSIEFGYFTADDRDPGRNLPGQTVFSCLSHDVIVHEVVHALVHRQREAYLMPTNVDVYAFHEAFADLLALFQHFTLPNLLESFLAQNRTDLAQRGPFVSLAQQFGEGSGLGKALRSALDTKPETTQLARTFEPHRRGAVLVAGVFDGFLATYQRAIADLLRIATGGTGELPPGSVHPDLVRRVAEEARRISARFMRMCIRAFLYLPAVDVTFGDFIRAVVTADRDINPLDDYGARSALVEGCRRRGIYATEVGTLVTESIAYTDASWRGLPPLPSDVVEGLVQRAAWEFTGGRGQDRGASGSRPGDNAAMARALVGWADENRPGLDLQPDLKNAVRGFHAAFRPTDRGVVQVDIVLQIMQSNTELSEIRRHRLGGIPLRGGTTVVADASGRVHTVVSKPVPFIGGAGELVDKGRARLDQVMAFVDEFDGHYTTAAWFDGADRVRQSLNFASVDGGR